MHFDWFWTWWSSVSGNQILIIPDYPFLSSPCIFGIRYAGFTFLINSYNTTVLSVYVPMESLWCRVTRHFNEVCKCSWILSEKFLKLELTIDSIPDNEHAGIILINATWITTMMNLEYLSIRIWCSFPLRMSWLKWNLGNLWNLLKSWKSYLMMTRNIHDVIQRTFDVSDHVIQKH